MSEFDLFLKGLNAVLRQFFQSVVEAGVREAELTKPAPQPETPQAPPRTAPSKSEPKAPRKPGRPPRSVDVYQKTLNAALRHPDGIQLRELAREIKMGWQTIVRPVNWLIKLGYLTRDDERKLYFPTQKATEPKAAQRASEEAQALKDAIEEKEGKAEVSAEKESV